MRTALTRWMDARRAVEKFDPDQPRDRRGRWTKVGGWTRLALSLLSDDELADAFRDVTTRDQVDEDALQLIDLEFARRDERHREMMAALDSDGGDPLERLSDVEDDSPVQRRIDELVASGRSYRDAYAEAHDLDPEDLAREDLTAIVDAQRMPGETREQTVRRLYDEHTQISYVQAEAWTNGHMLSPAGKAAGIDPITLFSGPRSRARKYASEELKRFWQDIEARQTYTEFRAAMLGRRSDVKAAKKIAGQGQEQDFGL